MEAWPRWGWDSEFFSWSYGSEWAAQGVFTLFAILFTFIGAQFVGLGLLGEYIGRIYQDVRARPKYCVQRVVGRRVSGVKSQATTAVEVLV